ncbi:tripartite tricarboxylate transporter TctB family protein [Salinibacterium sp. ZJ450]|uniref:tripartite tricarboxylate transporter TctB family protein n=1 Tax=Salinibacterium sp. ZJ450 TaxID=2708338 RepID=UPI001422A30A|nr:tripartite tricarboxylate transporter TctB family protein [Salinibacterium sp. ZJ450]
MTADPSPAQRSAGASRLSRHVGELIFAVLLFALGLYALIGSFAIRVPGNAQVGPTVFPILVSVILLGSSAVIIVGTLRGHFGPAEEGEDIDPNAKTDWLTLAKLTGLVIAHILLIPLIGWALAAAVLFGGAAWSLGAKRWWVALLVGLAVGLIIQIVFGELLGLSLPLGPVLSWLGPLI